jgi:UDP-N-acetylmuramate dehydrogenase
MNEKIFFEIKTKLIQKKIPFRENISLASLSSFKIGGISPLILEPENIEQILDIFELQKNFPLPIKILGGGSNLLISDTPDDFIVLRLSGIFKEFKQIEDGIFFVGSAANTTPTFKKISLLGYTGLEFLSTIPGWVGGAVIQNAGCYGGEIFNQIISVEYIRDGKFFSKKKKEIEFGYRFTEFLRDKNSIITGIQIQAERGNLIDIENSLSEKRNKRNSSQPENKKSAGSVFKNPTLLNEKGIPTKSWELIDKSGLRGIVVGGAQVSPEHCNFIVNLGDAMAKDVNYLVSTIQDKVFQDSKILLEREIEYFGNIK